MAETVTITRPDDWHLHLRDGEALKTTVPHAARQFSRAIVMPNLTPPVTTVPMALAYRKAILDVYPEPGFDPKMALYLTDDTSTGEISRAADCEETIGFKLYPAGATTNSDSGVTNISNAYPLFEAMEANDVPLLIHGEVTSDDIDIFDREKRFIDTHLAPIVERFADLRVVLEHATTRDAVQFVSDAPANVAATLTAHHLLFNRNSLLAGGIRPHYYCLPVLKRENHREALLEAATSGNPKFFLGTDSAPHAIDAKESSCGCAGCYTAYTALELYATAFDSVGALDRLDDFASKFGAQFYQLPINNGTVTLERKEWTVPEQFPYMEGRFPVK